MGANSKIEWCDHTFNPWIGCTKVSPGCAHCYAERDFAIRKKFVTWGKGQPRVRTSAANWKKPLQWNRQGRARIFCASLADVFDEEVPDDWRHYLFELIYECQNLTWLILTKRPLAAMEFIYGRKGAGGAAFAKYFPHVWIGVSAEDQARANERIPLLVGLPSTIRFLSVEPMLGPIDFGAAHSLWAYKIRWIIFGGESGPGARDCELDWIVDGLDQCRSAGVGRFVKQLGSRAFLGSGPSRVPLETDDSKGGDPKEWPEGLEVREFPAISQPSTLPSQLPE